MCTKQSSFCTHKYNYYKLIRPAIAVIMCLSNMANSTVGWCEVYEIISNSGVYITGTQGALHSSTVTWLKGWDRLSLALQCMPPILLRDLTIQQRNYLGTKGREPPLSSDRYPKIYCLPILHVL